MICAIQIIQFICPTVPSHQGPVKPYTPTSLLHPQMQVEKRFCCLAEGYKYGSHSPARMDQRGPICQESSTFSLCMGGMEFYWGSHAKGKLVPTFPCFVMFQCLLYQPGKHFCPQWQFPFLNEWIDVLIQEYTLLWSTQSSYSVKAQLETD